MANIIEVSSSGIKKLTTALVRFPVVIPKNMAHAGMEALNIILDTEGLRKYPPETSANRPPTPYYQRGLGTVYKHSVDASSENYGKKWEVESESYVARAKNTASYAQFLGGENQVGWASGYGWKKLFSTAKAMIPELLKIYDAWVAKTIKELGL